MRLNGVCFTLAAPVVSAAYVAQLLHHVRATGEAFLTPTRYADTPGMRAAFSNWQTEAADVDRVWQALLTLVEQLG